MKKWQLIGALALALVLVSASHFFSSNSSSALIGIKSNDAHASFSPIPAPEPFKLIQPLPSMQLQGSGTLTIPITVQNYSNVPRTNDPVRVAFPFALGQLNGLQSDMPTKIQVLDETQTPIAAYATITSRWNAPATTTSASIKFVDLDFQISSIAANATKTYYVRFNNAGTLSPVAPNNALNVSTQTLGGIQKYVVTAGNKTFHINKQKFTGFDLVQIASNVVAQGSSSDGYTLELEPISEVAESNVSPTAVSFDVTHSEVLNVDDQIQLEHYDQTSASSTAGSSSIKIKYSSSYVAGMQIRIGLGANQETSTIQSINGDTLTISPVLQFSHSSNEPVSIVNYPTRTISGITGNTITLNAALGYPLDFGIGLRKVSGINKFFSTSANNASVSLAEIEEQNPLRLTLHMISNLAEVGGTKTLSNIQVETRYIIHSNGLVDLETSLWNSGSRSVSYLQLNSVSSPKPNDLLIAQGYLKTNVLLPASAKTINFGSLPGSANVTDSFASNTTYTLTQDMFPTELDPFNRNAYTPADPTVALMQDNFHGKIQKIVGFTPSTLYQNLGQGAPNYFCPSGCTYSSLNQISLSNQPGLRFDNAIGLSDGTQGVAVLPHKYFWEEAPYGFETNGSEVKVIQYPKSIASGVKRVGPNVKGPFGAEDFLYPVYRLFGAERSTIRSSFVFFANSENLSQKMTEVKSRDYRLLPRSGDYIQSTQAFFGIEPYYTKNQMQSINWGALDNTADHFMRYHDVLHDWTRSDNSGSVNNDPVQGTKRSYYDYQFRTGANYSIFPHLGKQRAGAFDRRDGSTGLAFTNLYEMIKLLMMTLLEDDTPKPELYHWLDLSSDAMMNNFGTLQFSSGMDSAVYNGIEEYERDVEYEHPNRTHSWKQGQHMYAFFTGDALSKKVAARWFENYLIPNNVALNEGSPSNWNDCAWGRARANGWPAENAMGRYTFTGEPALLSAATNLVYYMIQCTQSPFNPDLALNFDPNPTISIQGVAKLWMDEMTVRAGARVLLAKQQAGILFNDSKDTILKTYANQSMNFLTGAGPGFSTLQYIWGSPYSFDPSVGTSEIGNESNPQSYHKAASCQAYPSPAMYSNPTQTIFPNNGSNYLQIDWGCVDFQGVTPLGSDYEGARIISNGYHASTISHLFRTLSSLPNTIPNPVAITTMKRLTRDGVLYNIAPDNGVCPAGNAPANNSIGIASGAVDLTNPACYTPIHGRLDQYIGSVFKSLPELLDSWDEVFWLANNVQDCVALGGQFCSSSQQCAGTLTTAIGTGGLTTCCVQPSGGSVPLLCVADTIAPTISNPLPNYGMLFGISQVSMSISTNENATCYYTQNLNYSFPSSGNPSIPSFSSTGTLLHSTLITNLPQPGSVTYRIFCRDPNNNVGASNHTLTVLPAGTLPFSVTNVQAAPADTSVVISWDTSVPTVGTIEYGLSPSITTTATISQMAMAHSLTISNLIPSSTYYFHILAADPFTNVVSTNFTTFITLPQQINLILMNPHYSQGSPQESSIQSNPNNHNTQYLGLRSGIGGDPYSGKFRGLLRFDISSIPSTIDLSTFSATLEMKVKSANGSGSTPMSVHAIISPQSPGFGNASSGTQSGESTWIRRTSPAGLWTNCPDNLSSSSAVVQCGAESDYSIADSVTTSISSTVGSTVSWNVTPLVRNWLDNSYPNYGFLIKAQTEAGASSSTYREFYSNNDQYSSPSSNVPKLIIIGQTMAVEPGASPPIFVPISPTANQSFLQGIGIPFHGFISNEDPNEVLTADLLLNVGAPPNPSNASNYILQTVPFTVGPTGIQLEWVYSPTLPLTPATYYWQVRITDSTNTTAYPMQSFIVQSNACGGVPPLCALQQGVCAGSAQSCASGAYSVCTTASYGPNFQTIESTCDDLYDNDCDGASNCNDSDCSTAPACTACGNNSCDALLGESCSTCTADCGVCAAPPSTNNNGGGGGGGSGGSGGGENGFIPNNNGNNSSGSGQNANGNNNGSSEIVPVETGNPVTDILATLGRSVVSAVSADAAGSLSTNLIVGVIILILAASAAAYFLGLI